MTDPKVTQSEPVPGSPDTQLEPGQLPNEVAPPSRAQQVLRDILGGSAMISVLAVFLALVAGGILIALTDKDVQQAAGYFFARPGDTFKAIWDAVAGAYVALFQGSVYNFRADDFVRGIRPLTETLKFATPLITAGLGVALAFRVGMFNIGGRGQMLVASAAAGYVAAYIPMPGGIHLIVAVLVGVIAGAAWGGIVGLLKARTGAHEVIVTIMLNYVAFYLVSYLLTQQWGLQAPGSTNPKSGPMLDTAVYPKILGDQFNLHLGFIVAIAATIWFWYFINRSSMGFRFRAVGENPHAAQVAGINVKSVYVWAMVFAGGLVGLSGVAQVLGTVTSGFTSTIDAAIGFDAITVALLGRSRPVGVFVAGVLFGALKAGGYSMQAAQGVPIDIVLVVQSLIVLFIAAPPLVRAIFRLPVPGTAPRSRNRKLEVAK